MRNIDDLDVKDLDRDEAEESSSGVRRTQDGPSGARADKKDGGMERDGRGDGAGGEDTEAAGGHDKLKKKEIAKEILGNSIFILIVLALTLLVVKYVGQRTVVSGQSMEPTLFHNDNLIVDKISYRFRDPERFDIIVFPFQYAEKTYYIKRIIGLPGETVRIDEQGNIYINDEKLEETYGAETIQDAGMASSGIVIGKNQYFVLGDNRNHSSDSRTPAVGLIDRKKIVGRAWIRVFPFNKFGRLKK